jgi:hypothetical protein
MSRAPRLRAQASISARRVSEAIGDTEADGRP